MQKNTRLRAAIVTGLLGGTIAAGIGNSFAADAGSYTVCRIGLTKSPVCTVVQISPTPAAPVAQSSASGDSTYASTMPQLVSSPSPSPAARLSPTPPVGKTKVTKLDVITATGEVIGTTITSTSATAAPTPTPSAGTSEGGGPGVTTTTPPAGTGTPGTSASTGSAGGSGTDQGGGAATTLPFTGFEVGAAAALGLAAIGSGTLFIIGSRRRRGQLDAASA